jgi:carboxyl-terminal processing protease
VFISSYVEYYDNKTHGYFIQNEEGTGLEFVTDQIEKIDQIDDKTCYIKFMSFSGRAVFEMDKVMAYAKNKGKTKVILDLRSNGGGQLDILCKVASHFVKSVNSSKPVLLYSKDVDGVLTHYSSATTKVNPNTEKIVVLANEYSASATECLIGAMLHYKFAFDRNSLIIEQGVSGKDTTYGKGIMQRTFLNVVTGEALKITTAQLYFPNKTTSIHGKGINTNPQNVCSPENVMTRALEIMAS